MEKQEDQLSLMYLQVTDDDILNYGNGASSDSQNLDVHCK